MKHKLPLQFGLLLAFAYLAGCVSNPPADVEDRSFGSPESNQAPPPERSDGRTVASSTYRVFQGDTLYSIAFKHGVDFRDLATWNRIDAPYRIYVGQELRLDRAEEPVAVSNGVVTTHAAPDQSRAAKVTTLTPTTSSPSTTKPASSSAPPSSAKPVAPQTPPVTANSETQATVAASLATVAAATAVKPASEPAAKGSLEVVRPTEPSVKPAPESGAPSAGNFVWRWPGAGKVVGSFSAGDQTRQGIDIAGKAGDPVLAAADGDIVYSGNGLLGYGELVIIKHNANFLSAYGHNRKRLVQEGDKVKAGQQIAEMGSSASARDELHFEIRKNGKPVNPLDYLPAH